MKPPVVNPNYGLLEWDIRVQVAMPRCLRRMHRTGIMGEIIGNETLPWFGDVPEDADDEVWKKWVGEQCEFFLSPFCPPFICISLYLYHRPRSHYKNPDTSNYHIIGTASMLPVPRGL